MVGEDGQSDLIQYQHMMHFTGTHIILKTLIRIALNGSPKMETRIIYMLTMLFNQRMDRLLKGKDLERYLSQTHPSGLEIM